MNKEKLQELIIDEIYFEQGSLFPEEVKADIDNIRNSIAWGTYFVKFMDDLYGEGGYGSPWDRLEKDKKVVNGILKEMKAKVVNLKSEELYFASSVNYKKLIEDPFISYIAENQKIPAQAEAIYSEKPKYVPGFVPAYPNNIEKFFIYYYYVKAMKDNLENPLAKKFREAMMSFISESEKSMEQWFKPKGK